MTSERRGDDAGESTHLASLVQSGRYRVASPTTLAMVRQLQASQEADGSDAPAASRNDAALPMKSMREFVIEHEGLSIGEQRRHALSQQWRFFLSCEPVQRGLDAGLIVGSAAAALIAVRRPRLRQPFALGCCFVAGFCGGLITVPLLVIAADCYNARRIAQHERELFARQRREFREK